MSEVPRAVSAGMSIASSLGLTADDAIVLHDSNRLTLRLLPCDVLARVAHVTHQAAQFEIELARRLATTFGASGTLGAQARADDGRPPAAPSRYFCR